MLYDLGTVSQPHCCQPVLKSLLGICVAQPCGQPMTLGDWLTKMATDDPSWTSQTSITP